MRYQAALRPDGRGINVASPRGPSQGLRVDDVGDTVLSVEATMRAWVTVGLLGFLGSSAFAGIDPACLGVAQPADYDEQTQGDFQANYFALASSFSALHAPIPHEPGHGAIGIDARVMPPLSCERRFVLNWTKTEQTNKSPLIPTIRASFAFPATLRGIGVGISIAVRAADPLAILWRAAVLRGQCVLARKAFVDIGRSERRIDRDALVKHEAFAVVVDLLAILEVLQNSTIELVDFFKAKTLHVGADFLAADSARAEHDHRLFFNFIRKGRSGCRKLTKVSEFQIDRIVERAQ